MLLVMLGALASACGDEDAAPSGGTNAPSAQLPSLEDRSPIACNARSCCALSEGGVACWGLTPDGRTGPARRVEPLAGTVEVRADMSAYVGRRSDGSIWRWARGDPEEAHPPSDAAAVVICGHRGEACALRSDRRTLVLPPGRSGAERYRFDATAVELDPWLAGGVCARLVGGAVQCRSWGRAEEDLGRVIAAGAQDVSPLEICVLTAGELSCIDTDLALSAAEPSPGSESGPGGGDRAASLVPAICEGHDEPIVCRRLSTADPLRPHLQDARGVASPGPGGHACVMDSEGVVWCLGRDRYGEAGVRHWMGPTTLPFGGSVRDVASSLRLLCALRADGRIVCLGRPVDYELGLADGGLDGTLEGPRWELDAPEGSERLVLALPGAHRHRRLLAITSDGEAYVYEIRHGGRWEPLELPSGRAARRVSRAATVEGKLCVLASGRAYCEGDELGALEPRAQELSRLRDLYLVGGKVCGRTSERHLRCEGDDEPMPIDPQASVVASGRLLCVGSREGRWRCRGADPFGASTLPDDDGPDDDGPAAWRTAEALEGFTEGAAGVGAACFWRRTEQPRVACAGMSPRLVPVALPALEMPTGAPLPRSPELREIELPVPERLVVGPTSCTLTAGEVRCFGRDPRVPERADEPQRVVLP